MGEEKREDGAHVAVEDSMVSDQLTNRGKTNAIVRQKAISELLEEDSVRR